MFRRRFVSARKERFRALRTPGRIGNQFPNNGLGSLMARLCPPDHRCQEAQPRDCQRRSQVQSQPRVLRVQVSDSCRGHRNREGWANRSTLSMKGHLGFRKGHASSLGSVPQIPDDQKQIQTRGLACWTARAPGKFTGTGHNHCGDP